MSEVGDFQVRGNQCDQCGLFHPPLKPGERCPNAAVKDGAGKEIDFSKFLASMKNILASQFELKKIQDHEKVFKEIIVRITKFLEDYKE